MPEATINEDRESIFRKIEVGASGNAFRLQYPAPQTCPHQRGPQATLGSLVPFAADLCHRPRACRGDITKLAPFQHCSQNAVQRPTSFFRLASSLATTGEELATVLLCGVAGYCIVEHRLQEAFAKFIGAFSESHEDC